jgi:hypothetical protein
MRLKKGMGRLLTGESENAVDAGKHLFEAGDFVFEVLGSGLGEAINAGGAALGGDASLSLQPAFAEHALEGGIERTFFNLEQIFRDLLDVLDEGVAVHGPEAEGLEDHDFECAGEEVAVFGISGHEGILA